MAVAVVVGALITAAAVTKGFPAADLRLNDGSVWVTNGTSRLVGKFNAQIDELSVGVPMVNSDFDILQNGDNLVTVDNQSRLLQQLDSGRASLGTPALLPPKARVSLGRATVAVTNPANGSTFFGDLGAILGVDLVKGKPDLQLGPGGVSTVTSNGNGIGLSVDTDELVRIGADGKPTTVKVPFDVQAGTAELAAVGEKALVLDRAQGRLWVEGGKPVSVPDAASAQLQAPSVQPFQSAHGQVSALVATLHGLYGVVGGKLAELSPGITGTPIQPVVVAGCGYGAFLSGTSGEVAVACDGKGGVPFIREAIPSLPRNNALTFRVNRDVVVLNDAVGGNIWLPNQNMKLIAGWEKVAPPKPKRGDSDNTATTELIDPNRSGPNRPPVALDDTLRARAGASTILPIMDNDSDPDGDIITVTSDPKINTHGVSANRIRGGTALQITVPDDLSGQQITFTYTINDGRGGDDSATVRLDVIDAKQSADNKPPVPKLPDKNAAALTVGLGKQITTHVLNSWREPDGDDLVLLNAKAPGDDEATFTPDGTLTYIDVGVKSGRKEIAVTVSDGVESTQGTVVVNVTKSDRVPPVANGDYARATSGQPITIEPLTNDQGDNLNLSRVAPATAGPVVVPNLDDGTFTFKSAAAGTYYLQYVVSNGENDIGLVRVDVTDPASANRAPVATRDAALLPDGGKVLVDPLANDEDPDNDVLVLQSVSSDPRVKLEMIQRNLIQVTSVAQASEPIYLTYTMSDGLHSVDGTLVLQPAPPGQDQRPQARTDTAVVRAGNTASVRVLRNDTSPAGLDLTLNPKLAENPAAGAAWTDGENVRFTAPAEAGEYSAVYTIHDSEGRTTSAQVQFTVIPAGGTNSPPQAPPVTGRVLAGTSAKITIPLEGVDPDGDSTRLLGLNSGPELGRVTAVDEKWLVYQAYPTSAGTDTFSYAITDSLGAKSVGTVRVGVVPKSAMNNPPEASDDLVTARPGRTVRLPVLANDSDPDGDSFGFDDPALDFPAATKAAVINNNAIQLVLGSRPGRTVGNYSIVDDRGGSATGHVTIVSDPTAPLLAPVLTDDVVSAAEVAQKDLVDIPVLANDYDPDGDIYAATVSVPAYGAPPETAAKVVGTGTKTTVQVHVGNTMQTIRYQVSDTDGQLAWAVIVVPGKADTIPALRGTVKPQTVVAGKNLDLAINDFVIGTQGRKVILTADQRIWASHGNGTATSLNGIRFVAPVDYAGPASITFEVTDGKNRQDTNGRTAVLSIPITVLPAPQAKNEPPQTQPVSLTIGAGEPAKAVDLARSTKDPEGQKLTFTEAKVSSPSGVSVSTSGSVVTAKADLTARTGGSFDVHGTVTDSKGAKATTLVTISVQSTSKPPPVAVDDSVTNAVQGKPVGVNVLANDTNPFPDKPLRIVDTRLDSGSASVSLNGTEVQITPGPTFVGTVVVRYTVQDATGDPNRQSQAAIKVTVIGRPGKPGVPRIGEVGDRHAVLTFTGPPDNGSPIKSYLITGTGAGGPKLTRSCPSTTCTVPGLTNDVRYHFTVVAINGVGSSLPSGQSGEVRPDVKPGPVSRPSAGWGDQTAKAVWRPPVNRGSPIQGYDLQIGSSSANTTVKVAGSVTSYQAKSLKNGETYRFRVRAVNKADSPGDWSPYSVAVAPAGPPSPPRNVRAGKPDDSSQYDGNKAKVTWQPPANENGAHVETYLVYQNGKLAKTVPAADGTTTTVSGLAAGSTYTYTVRARHRGGTSDQSATSPSFTSYPDLTALPAPQIIRSSTSGNPGTVTFSWQAASRNGPGLTYQYRVTNTSTGGTDIRALSTNPADASVALGPSYTIAVRGVRAATSQTTPWSGESNPGHPYAPPPTPSVSGRGNARSATFSWSVASPANGLPVTVRYRVNGGGWVAAGNTGSKNVGNAYSTTYRFDVQAVNSQGQTSSVASATAKSGPAPPPPPPPVSKKEVTLKRGARNNPPGCDSQYCRHVVVVLAGFSGSVGCTFHSSDHGSQDLGSYGNGTHQASFTYGYLDTTWVTCGGVDSPRRPWTSQPLA